ncbi:MAG: branched-chain amino acid ABC transporter permease [Desulfobacteraceae bacterium]
MAIDLKKLVIITGIIILLIVVPLITTRTDLLTWFFLTLLYITLSQSWNVIGGYAGQVNLGHAAFFGIGALIARYIWLHFGLPLPFALLGGALAATIFAMIIGFPAFRLKGIYFVIGTLVLAEILRLVFYTILPEADVMPMKLLSAYSLIPRYYLSLVFAVLSVAAVYWISRSRLGMGLLAVREDEEAAEASGVNTQKHKLLALLISTFMAGLTGGIYAYYGAAFRAGGLFEPVWTFDAVIIVFVGGVGTIIGPIIGSVFFVLLKQFLSLYLPGGMHVAVFGVLFIIVVLFLPEGLVELITKVRHRFLRGGSQNVS